MEMEDFETESLADSLVLWVVDMQPTLLKAIDPDGALLRRTEFAIRAAKLLGMRVIFTEQVPEKLGPTAPLLIEAAGGEDQALVFSKTAFNGFGAPGIDRFFAGLEDTHLIIAGIETPICIYQTVLDGLGRDFQITLFSDCIGARREEDATHIIRVLAGAGATILPSESVFYSILAEAGHPAFQEFTQLVKDFN